MPVKCQISRQFADFYVEAYTGDDFEGDLRPKTTIAYVAGYRNYDEPESKQIATWLKIKKNITEALRSYEDGYVTVKLVIKEECINP